MNDTFIGSPSLNLVFVALRKTIKDPKSYGPHIGPNPDAMTLGIRADRVLGRVCSRYEVQFWETTAKDEEGLEKAEFFLCFAVGRKDKGVVAPGGPPLLEVLKKIAKDLGIEEEPRWIFAKWI
ncbi:hypothetical protein E1B28_010823 [Marasmius oreades]|uniref:Uncharacterized protein n=1 Tax=Marasmius oreades TaxID=181124 RepID=A0A9P7RSV3_9AGAR|nr:uncharacterized protein E1B28_010823 [Marasmius oreades]KAG7089114.1 hypothetical protein E1B28_010823 [Marasmius oreades]